MKTKTIVIVTALLGGTAFANAQTTLSSLGDSLDHATHAQDQPLQDTILTEREWDDLGGRQVILFGGFCAK
jgi:hypothetical protein